MTLCQLYARVLHQRKAFGNWIENIWEYNTVQSYLLRTFLTAQLSILLLIVLRTNPIASLTSISSLHSCYNKHFSVPLLAPIRHRFPPRIVA
jgi:hypothetical protein